METLRRTASVLIFPVLAWVAVACEKTLPTEPRPVGAPTTGSNWSGSSGTTRWVNDDGTVYLPPGNGCNNPGYQHIQDAVKDANPGDRINVCPGTYAEQVTVGMGKDNITLKSVGLWKAVIKAPTLMMFDAGDTRYSIVRVSYSNNVTIVGFTISGPGPGPCNSLHYGVRVDNGASANILGNHIIHIRDEPFGGCGNGLAVVVGRLGAASAQVLGNVIEDYQKNGPTVLNGSNATISFNRVIGHGPNSLESQNGIQVSDGATGTVRHNFVSQNISGGGLFGGIGVLFFSAGQVVSEHNTVTANDYGVYSNQTAGGTSVTESRVRGSTFDGIVLDGSNYHQVSHNASDHNSGLGVSLYDEADNNSIVRNQVQNNDFGGILLDLGSSNTVSTNHVKSNGHDPIDDITDGIRINTGSGNTVTGNHLKNNITHDCHDETLTLNTWSDNGVGTSYPAGLCGYDDDDGEDVNTFGWDASYPWYLSFSDAADLDFVTGYSQFDLSSLLQLLPSIRISATRPRPSPGQ